MCGRFANALSGSQIRGAPRHRGVDADEWIDEDHYVPRYNIAPRTNAPVLRRRNAGPSDSTANGDQLVLHTMKWGLVPHWSKFEDKTLSTTNARAENLAEGGGMWGSIKGKKRCAILCQGYFEWLTKGKEKLPHFTKHKDERMMLLAGLYDCVVLEGQTGPLWTFTIVTTAANNEFSWLHDRQPVILSNKEALDKWLDTRSQSWTPELSKFILQPYHDSTAPLECYQVPKEVGKIGTESPSFILPVSQRKDGIEAMFSKQMRLQSESKEVKRKRTPNPPPDSTDSSIATKHETAEMEVDDDIIILDGPPSPKKLKVQHADDSTHPPASTPPKRKTVRSHPPYKMEKGKITSFFIRSPNK